MNLGSTIGSGVYLDLLLVVEGDAYESTLSLGTLETCLLDMLLLTLLLFESVGLITVETTLYNVNPNP